MSKSALLSLAACLLLACGSRSQLHVPPPNEASVAGPRSARLEARFTHSCHADEDGRVRCWGRNTRGALGPGVSIAETPVELPLGGFITAVTVGHAMRTVFSIKGMRISPDSSRFSAWPTKAFW